VRGANESRIEYSASQYDARCSTPCTMHGLRERACGRFHALTSSCSFVVSLRVFSVCRLLSELDGIEPLRQVTIIAATNRPDLIDAALLRPGRIDRILYVSPPDQDSCAAILRIEFSRIGAAVTGVDPAVIAAECVGMSGAELAALCREAALVAMEDDLRSATLTTEHFLRARKRITLRITPHMLQFYADYRAKSALVSV
jgi:AAA family ATPase